MPLPDNRLRFSPTKIDFANEVGVTSQDHDNYPPPQGQARFDHMRMVVIALLSQQSSYEAPTEFRDGTPWFDLNTNTLKIRVNTEWVPYSDAIGLGALTGTGTYKTLTEWYEQVENALSIVSQEITYSGLCTEDSITTIGIPEALLQYLYSDTRAYVYVNGLLLDPRACTIVSSYITLSGILLDRNDEYTVILRRVPNASFYTESVNIP